MKKCLVFIILLLSIAILASDLQREGLKGAVERVMIYRTSFEDVGGQWQAKGEEIRRVKVFSPLGEYVIVGLYMDGKEYSRTEYTYDEHGTLKEKRYFKNNYSTYETRTVFTYDSRGHLIEEIVFEYWPSILGGDRMLEKTVISYDSRGYVSSRERLNNLGLVLGSVRYVNDDRGRLIRESIIDKNGLPGSTILYKYEGDDLQSMHVLDSANRIIEEVTFDSENRLYDRSLFSYVAGKAVSISRRVSDDYIVINETVELVDGERTNRRVQISFTLEPIIASFDNVESLELKIDRTEGGTIRGIEVLDSGETLATAKYHFESGGRVLLREYSIGDTFLRIDYKYDMNGNWIEERYFRLEAFGYRPVSSTLRKIDYLK